MQRCFLLLALAAGCGPLDAGRAASEDTLGSRSGTPSLASLFNRPAQGHNDQCVRLEGVTELRYADFTPTGFTLDPSGLRFNARARPTDDDDGHRCRDGEVQLDAREILSTPSGRLLFHRGGYGYVGATNVKYGHVWIGDLRDHAEVFSSDSGNGQPCLASTNRITEGHYRIRVASIPPDMHYRKTSFTKCVAARGISACLNGYRSYGDPGFDQGDRQDLGIHYSYLVWSWINVRSGGVVRSLLRPGQVFHRCNVRSIRLDSYDDNGRRNGWVQAIYGKTRQADEWLYGWTVYAHQRDGDPEPTYHVEPL